MYAEAKVVHSSESREKIGGGASPSSLEIQSVAIRVKYEY